MQLRCKLLLLFFDSRRHYQGDAFPLRSNRDRLAYHLHMKCFIMLLRVCPQNLLANYICSPAFSSYSNEMISILINSTIQNQLAVKRYQADLPKSQNHPIQYQQVLFIMNVL